jgi:hypothetical protein
VAAAQGIARRALTVHRVADPLPVGSSAQPPSPSCTGPSARRPLSGGRSIFFPIAATSVASKTGDPARFLAILPLVLARQCKAGLGRRCDHYCGSWG